MNNRILTTALLFCAISPSDAEEKDRSSAPICYVADQRKSFQVAAVSLDTMREHHPNIEYGSDNSPLKLTWQPMPAGTTVTADMIGRFQGRQIYRLVYKTATDKGQEFDFALLALDDHSNQNPVELRPFFLLPCDQVRWLEICPVSYEDCPFGIEVEQTIKGTGVYTDSWLLKLTNSGARLIEKRQNGRGMEPKTRRYK